MDTIRRFMLAGVAATAIAGSVAVNAGAADEQFGQHVAMCAHQLGQRTEPPAVTCTHDGMTMTFANFGQMVEHMRQIH